MPHSVFRAFAEAGQGHFAVAAEHLARAEPLAGKSVALDLQVQQRLLLGLEASIDGRTREAKLHCLSAVCLALEEVHLGAAFAALKVMALRNLLGVEDVLKLLEVMPLPSHEKYWARLLLEAAQR